MKIDYAMFDNIFKIIMLNPQVYFNNRTLGFPAIVKEVLLEIVEPKIKDIKRIKKLQKRLNMLSIADGDISNRYLSILTNDIKQKLDHTNAEFIDELDRSINLYHALAIVGCGHATVERAILDFE